MTEKLLDLENDLDLDDSEMGGRYLFWCQQYPDSEKFSFSSTLENIPYREKHDRSLKNKTEVLVLSDPTEAWHPMTGTILVSKIFFGSTMWIATSTLIPVDDKSK
jgi:hypothetical protein